MAIADAERKDSGGMRDAGDSQGPVVPRENFAIGRALAASQDMTLLVRQRLTPLTHVDGMHRIDSAGEHGPSLGGRGRRLSSHGQAGSL
jgi:hypothetical protein